MVNGAFGRVRGLLLGLSCVSSGCGDSGGGAAEGTDTAPGTDDASATATSPSSSTTASTGDPTSDTDDPDTGTDGSSETGDPPQGGPDRVGIFNAGVNYFELDVEGEPLKFHYGASNSRWGAARYPIAGDFDGDGLDTVGLFDSWARTFVLADVNDSDEFAPQGTEVELTGVAQPPTAGEAAAEIPVAGDWAGSGHAGVGVFHPGSNTFYLKDQIQSGAPDITLTLDVADGYPAGGWPVAGDFDGDGLAEVGISDGTTVYIRNELSAGPPDTMVAAAGFVFPGDFDDDGIDTLATLDWMTNEIQILDQDGAVVDTFEFGYAEPGYWSWFGIAGAWQVPEAPVASQGYEWTVADPANHGVNAAALSSALDDGENTADVYSVLVVRDGELIGERYYHGFDRHIAGNIKSVSKGVLSALFGIALDDGIFGSQDDTVSQHLPSYFNGLSAEKQAITLGDILTMRGGLQWNENSGNVGGMIAAPDMLSYVVELPLQQTPGTTYNYSTGLTHVGSGALTEAAGMSTQAFARQHLFEPLEISAPRWDASPEGYFVGGAEMWMRPRDMARFGQMYLRDGEGILTTEWVTLSANPFVPESGGRFYGIWWRERPWSNYPADDSFFAWGYGGQFIFLYPTWDMIVIVTSKWNVNGSQSGTAASAIFSLVDNQILTAVL